ncbi:LacI family DNA-binding transcriptional regulator [Gluconacetobacter sacchari]|uniref:LacI family DNA-binding transcriptional regulator n=2 Tax=Gluconacetobacter sacchari TaxID=92759 RepID=A0A7W4IEC6_9PROT|nr:LacI family DNA-binding transcriptional regulator [Gluconacetobacter sacchari]MBB2161303.1 LacI family DNA-binding transcriptional regulator [Gluconacetobacter sacchari]GBQ23597.1 LacI family transcriptional regulator [Gluconacetobacter sacchari DSM 12717]
MSEYTNRRPVSLLDVAKAAGVSRATASLVLRESPLVADGTRQRVVETMKNLGYIYNRGAANLRRNSTGTIGLVLSNIGSPFYSTLMAGVDETNEAGSIVTLVANSVDSPDRQIRQIRRLREHNVDGIILCPAIGSDETLAAELARLDLPCVQALRHAELLGGDYVGADYRSGIEKAVRHLVGSGRRRIVFVGATTLHSAARERNEGFRHAIRMHGLNDGLVVAGAPDNAYDVAALDRLLKARNPPDAAVCYNDVIALDVMNRLRSHGRQPGQDFAVIGMDNLPQAAGAFPALTTIATHPREVGQQAAALLQKRIAQLGPSKGEHIIVPPSLIVRRSCGEASVAA